MKALSLLLLLALCTGCGGDDSTNERIDPSMTEAEKREACENICAAWLAYYDEHYMDVTDCLQSQCAWQMYVKRCEYYPMPDVFKPGDDALFPLCNPMFCNPDSWPPIDWS